MKHTVIRLVVWSLIAIGTIQRTLYDWWVNRTASTVHGPAT